MNGPKPDIQDGRVFPRTQTELTIATIWQDLLDIDQISIHDNFFELGGDSFTLIAMAAQATHEGLGLTPEQIFHFHTIAELAAASTTSSPIQAEQDLVLGSVPLMLSQYWFLNIRNTSNPHYYNSILLWDVLTPMKHDLLEKTIYSLLRHHDALRLGFEHDKLGWRQYIAGPDTIAVPIRWVDVATLSAAEQAVVIEKTAAQLQTSLNLIEGPLWQVAYIDLGPQQPGLLLWIFHHLIFDTFSKRILLEDFVSVYNQFCQNQEIRFPLKTTSLKQWSERLRVYTESAALRQELDNYWLKLPWTNLVPLPVDFVGESGFGTVESSRVVKVSLSISETNKLLEQVLNADVQILDVLLASLACALLQWTGSPLHHIVVVDHGRWTIFHDIDLSRTVGWVAFYRDILLNLEGVDTMREILPLVRQQLKDMPNRGMGYSLLRYFSTEPNIVESLTTIPLPRREVVLDYTGQVYQNTSESALARTTYGYLGASQDMPISAPGSTTYLGMAPGYPGSSQDIHEQRDAKLFCAGSISNDQLCLKWEYSSSVYHHATIEKLALSHIEALRVLAIGEDVPFP